MFSVNANSPKYTKNPNGNATKQTKDTNAKSKKYTKKKQHTHTKQNGRQKKDLRENILRPRPRLRVSQCLHLAAA